MTISLILKEFYKEFLGFDLPDVITYSSLNNVIYFSADVAESYHAIGNFSDRIFNLTNVIPDENKRFSILYCEIVRSLNNAFNDTKNQYKRSQVIRKIEEKKNQIKNTNSNIDIGIYQKELTNLQEQLDKLNTSYTQSIIGNAYKYCNIQNGNDINAKKADDSLFMEIKNSSGKYYEPKIVFQKDISSFLKKDTNDSTTHSNFNYGSCNIVGCYLYDNYIKPAVTNISRSIINSATDIISWISGNTIKKENVNTCTKKNIDIEKLKLKSNYFESYEINFFEDGIQKIVKATIAFERIEKVPIEFAWFDPKIYQISNKEVDLTGDYRMYAKYCRIPNKIIIGVNPTIIYAQIIRKNDKTDTEKEAEYSIPEHPTVVLGYELDSDLCDSALVGVFKSCYNEIE